MIHMNKPAAKQPSKETIQFVYKRDKYRCRYCGGPAQGKPHHWAIHNTKTNRLMYPLLVHHPANLICTDLKCHQQHGSGDNLPGYRAGAIELVLAAGGDCYLDIDEQGKLSIITKELS